MAQFHALAELAEEMAATASRLKKRAAITEAIRTVEQREPAAGHAGLFAQYLAGLPFAEWDPRKLNAGGALLTRAVKQLAAADDAQLGAAYRHHGDLGAAAFDLLEARGVPAADPGQPPAVPERTPQTASPSPGQPPLTLTDVRDAFAALASARTTAARAALVDTLLRRASPLEAKYLLKLMLGDMRTGVKQSLVEEAIAVAADVPVAQLRHAIMLEADLAGATTRAFAGTLAEARLRLFHPLGFMLASPVNSAEEAAERFRQSEPASDAAVRSSPGQPVSGVPSPAEIRDHPRASTVIHAFLEDKYDGMRAQVHFGDPGAPGRVVLYSRNREDITASYPELAEAFAAATGSGHSDTAVVGATVLDGEILGWDFAAAAEDESGDPTVSARGLYDAHAANNACALNGGDGPARGVPHASQYREEWPDDKDDTVTRGPATGRALPFAVLGQRIGRKRVANEMRSRVPVIFMAFDLMVDHGELILHLPLRERRARLEALAERIASRAVSPLEPAPPQAPLFPHPTHNPLTTDNWQPTTALPRLLLSPSRLVQSAEDIDRAYAAARARSNEGVMIKAVASIYQPGRRGLAWVKLKRELATLDVVITGAEYGHGRRAGTLSDYTFAVRRGPRAAGEHEPADSSGSSDSSGPADSSGSGDPAELLNVGKAYSGVTDAEIAELTAFLKAHTLEDYGHFRTVEPLVVLEVAFNNVMRSDRHASGFALRFPRILRLRPDKPLAEIDTLARVEAIYHSQVDKPAEAPGE